MVMFFGLCNSPATFQAMMDSIFKDYISEAWLIDFIDDLLIFADTKEELHLKTLKVLQRLRENDLYLKPEKAEFCQTKLSFLGMIIEEGKISMDPSKLKGIRDWPTPTSVKEVRQFLGFGNFYRKFIYHYSQITRPLNNLLRKAANFEWNILCDKAFEELKAKFTKEPVLLMPDMTRPFRIEADASKYASGAVLTQEDPNGKRHPCAFISKTFSPTEQNYPIYDRELLAVLRALREWRHYVIGSPHTTTILSDHQNLLYYQKPQNLKPRQARWSLEMSEYDIKLIHTPGQKMIQSDALSRRPDLMVDNNENDNLTMLPENLFIRLIDEDLSERIQTATNNDNTAQNIINLLRDTDNPLTKTIPDWEIVGTQLFKDKKQYILKNTDLRQEIVKMFHDTPMTGHPGQLETFNQVAQFYWWPRMRTWIKKYVNGCIECQQFKIKRRPTIAPLSPIEGPKSN